MLTTNHQVTAAEQPPVTCTSYLHHQQNVGIINQRLPKTSEELTISYVPNIF
jgi:hypothetical protein